MRIFFQSILMFMVSIAFAHEGDHSAPGAIPFAPHGGKAVEASELGKEHDHEHEGEKGHDHEEEHDHEHGEEAHKDKDDHGHDHDDKKSTNAKKEPSLEYFFEATYANGKLSVYPLALDEENPKEFILVNVEGALSNLRATVEFPRSKRTENVPMQFVRDEKRGDHWQGQVPSNKDIRFFVNVQANWKGVERKSRIHLEKRK